MLHVMKYRRADDKDSVDSIKGQLEGWLDRLQPGWRNHVIQDRCLPCLLAAHAVPLAGEGGIHGRPSTTVPDWLNVHLAGDWVGNQGILADAATASAEKSVREALACHKDLVRAG